MVAIHHTVATDYRLAHLRDLLLRQRAVQANAAAHVSACCASNGQFLAGTTRGIDFALVLVQEAIDDELAMAPNLPVIKNSAEEQELADWQANQNRMSAARSAARKDDTPGEDGNQPGVFRQLLGLVLHVIAWGSTFGFLKSLGVL